MIVGEEKGTDLIRLKNTTPPRLGFDRIYIGREDFAEFIEEVKKGKFDELAKDPGE